MKKILYIFLFLALILPSVSSAATKKAASKPAQCMPDPALLKQLADLKAQNADLTAQVTRLKNANASLSTDSTTNTSSKSLTVGCLNAKNDVVYYNKQTEQLADKYRDLYNERTSNQFMIDKYGGEAKIKSDLESMKNSEKTSNYYAIQTAQAEVQKYCY